MRRIESIVVGIAALAIYLLYSPPVSGSGDSSEFTLVLATNGVAHPTGYPLYTLAGHCFVALVHAAGLSWPFAANAWSAVGGAVTIGFLHAIGSELIGPAPGIGAGTRFVVALLVLVPLALDPVMMDAATTAEINVWSVAWVAVAAFAFARALRRIADTRGSASRGLERESAAWGLVCGAGLAHHATSVLVAVPLSIGIAVALRSRGRLSARLVLVSLAGAMIPLASYGIIAWRAWHPAAVQWESLGPDWGSVFGHVTGAQYRGLLGRFAPRPDNLLGRAVYPLLIPGLACLLWSSARAKAGEERVLRVALLAAAAAVTGFAFFYGVPDPEPYFLPPLALGVAGAAMAAADLLRARFMGRGLRLATGAAAVAGAIALAVPWCREAAGVRREVIDYEVLIRSMWESIPPDSAIVLWRDDRVMRLREYQLLRGEKPALYVATPDAMVDERSRAKFAARFGFDPLEGITLPNVSAHAPNADVMAARVVQRFVAHINARTSIPVIDFNPEIPLVRKRYKPWERAAPAGG